MTIRTRLLLLYVAVAGLSCAGLLWWITAALRIRYLESMEESLVDTSVILASLLETQVQAGRIGAASFRGAFAGAYARRFDARIYALRKTSVDLRVTVTDRLGIVVYDSDGGRDEGRDYSRWNDVHLTLLGRYGARATRSDPRDESSIVVHVAAPIRAADGAIAGVVTVGKPTTYINRLVSAARRRVVCYGGGVALVLVAVGWLVTTWLTRPLERLTSHALALRDGRPSAPPELSGPEVVALGRALEQMRDALEGKNYVENYVQTLTHQLKAPLAAVRAAAELLQEDMPADDRARFLESIRAEAGRIRRIVDRLLQLAALEKRKGIEDVERIDLRELAAEVAEELRPALAARSLSIAIEAPEPPPPGVRGERFLLRQALVNLLHNAVEFSPRGGAIAIAVRTGADGVRVEILDRGPGVPDFALGRVFERFYSLPRPDTGAKSTGLGLSLVREIAHLHGGQASLENRAGGGARAVLALPAAT
jgi:two-component system sensor histidine kinase CreC